MEGRRESHVGRETEAEAEAEGEPEPRPSPPAPSLSPPSRLPSVSAPSSRRRRSPLSSVVRGASALRGVPWGEVFLTGLCK